MIKNLRFMLAPVALALSITVGGIPLVPLLAVTTLAVTTTACPFSKDDAVTWAKRAVSGLEKALPTLQGAGVDVAKVREAIEITNKIVTALEKDDNQTAVGLSSSLITAFEGIVADTERISNPATRTLILAILAVVDLAIHEIADALAKNPPAGMRGAPPLMKLKQYGAKNRWSCRSSQNGQYAKMSFCEKHPDVSQVETR